MARRKRVEEHVNHERWLVSYADFITLLFAFFVVMYSISSVNEGKYRVLSNTLENVFSEAKRSKEPIQIGELSRGNGDETTRRSSDIEINLLELARIETYTPPPVDEEIIQTIEEISQQLNDSLAELIENDDVSIKYGEDWLELEIKSKVLFESGESRLEESAEPIMADIATILNAYSNPIQVEGFTDNDPINTPKFPSNWELSAARAASVVHLLDIYGVDSSRMSAVGYGEFKPITDNSTKEGRQKNRRVVLVVLGSNNNLRTAETFKSPPKKTTSSSPLPVAITPENQ
ncbi:MAG: flagellar motor protein MotD [Piscirickettsiaceae bacterium]|nr:flagellar motor protein MotD [Piscirickettsiaceae bacterium]